MKYWLFFIGMGILGSCGVSTAAWTAESQKAQKELNEEFTNPETSILTPEDFEDFKGLDFYPIDPDYIVRAKLIRTPDEEPFEMPTTTARRPIYRKYGELHFELQGEAQRLSVYQNLEFSEDPELEDYLFLPFKDDTNEQGTYGGGRYMELRIPKKNTLLLDFNKAYNPYCAYNPKYSCPLVPEENILDIPIEAGVKVFFPAF